MREKAETKNLGDQLPSANNQIGDLENRLDNAEAKMQRLSLDIKNLTIFSPISSGSLSIVIFVLGIKFVRLKQTLNPKDSA